MEEVCKVKAQQQNNTDVIITTLLSINAKISQECKTGQNKRCELFLGDSLGTSANYTANYWQHVRSFDAGLVF